MKTSFLRAGLVSALTFWLLLQPVLAHPETVIPASPTAAKAAAVTADATDAPAPTATSAIESDPADRLPKSISPEMTELSPWSMFWSAHVVVKAVIIWLAVASLTTWTIFVAKSIELALLRRRLRSGLKSIVDARSLTQATLALTAKNGILRSLLAAASKELQLSADLFSVTGIKERAASSLEDVARAEVRRIRIGMGVLATIGATSPFIGLFGTVWGIMNSFIGISKSQTTNLAVVAPGIAEALLATATGLVAAIPAVIIYNHFARSTRSHLELVRVASGAAARLLSRELDRNRDAMHLHAAE